MSRAKSELSHANPDYQEGESFCWALDIERLRMAALHKSSLCPDSDNARMTGADIGEGSDIRVMDFCKACGQALRRAKSEGGA